ncbi:transporter, major facilitator subfamily protein [Pelomyxa schiedti]|nr:transporter, major facilitator subfamily protein [Pelomyxa schiedti]
MQYDKLPINNKSENKGSAKRHLCNLFFVSTSFFFVFLAFNGTQTIESSIVPGDLGYWSVATIYITFAVSALFLSSGVVKKLSPKWSMAIGTIAYAVYVGANLYPQYYTLIPTAAMVGVSASILWAGEGAYVSIASTRYSVAVNKPPKASMGLFNGVFFGIFQLASVIGNIITSVILGLPSDNSSKILFLVFAILCLCGIFSLFILPTEDPIKSTSEEEPIEVKPTPQVIREAMLATFQLMRDRRMSLLIPPIFYSGLSEGFVFSDFTNSIIATVLGIEWVGYIMALFFASDSISSFVFGKLVDTIGKRIMIVCGTIAHVVCLLFFILWLQFEPLDGLADGMWPATIWICAALLGLGDAVFFGVLPNSMMGTWFSESREAAFSNMKLWQSVGFAIGYIWGPYLGLQLKCVLVFATLIVAVYSIIVLDRAVCNLNHKHDNKSLVN